MKTLKTHSIKILLWGVTLLALPAAFGSQRDEFKMMDTDKDGRISRAEHAQGARQVFAQMDADNDAVVTAPEMDACNAKMAANAMARERKGEKSSAEIIAMFDLNADGRLTQAEHDAGNEKLFAKVDADGDGYLSKEECEAGHKMMQKEK